MTQEQNESSRRWGKGDRTSQDEARQRIVDAARQCYQVRGIKATTMGDIAKQAQVVRATLYRYFKGKEQVLQAVFYQEIQQFLQQFEQQVQPAESFCDYLLQFMLYSRLHAPLTPIHQQFFQPDIAVWVSRQYLADNSAVELTSDLLRDNFELAQARGEIHADLNLNTLVNWIARLLISYILVPESQPASEAELRQNLQLLLIRGLKAHP